MRVMPDEERVETLNDLQAARIETRNTLERMPVGISGRSVKLEKAKQELEEKLARLERAIETFSKQTVYVAVAL